MGAESISPQHSDHGLKAKTFFSTSINPISTYTEVHESGIHGLGVFAKVFIPKGTIWWHPEPKDVLLVTRNQYAAFTKSVQNPMSARMLDALHTYCYYSSALDSLVFCLDNARFVNHSEMPTSGAHPSSNPLMAMALRDLEPGEEILENYRNYDRCSWSCLYKDFLHIP
jgi:hypothetical protein